MIDKSQPETDLPIFIHSSWRTSSTWLWLKFRDDERLCAYCEAFNEQLATFSPTDAAMHNHASWPSGHPESLPYFMEFEPLIRDRGVAGFDSRMAFEWFWPTDGVGGDLRPTEHQYLTSLIDHARSQDKRPVLTFTRSLGRVAAIKRSFEGTHIFSYRSLLAQWLSYVSQERFGNYYFSTSHLRQVLFAADGDDVLRLFKEKLCKELDRIGVSDEERYKFECGEIETLGRIAQILPPVLSFSIFFHLHIYLYCVAHSVCDICVDTSALPHNPIYFAAIQTAIHGESGVHVDLSDARFQFRFQDLDYPALIGVLVSETGCFDLIKKTLRGLSCSQNDIDFADTLYNDTINELNIAAAIIDLPSLRNDEHAREIRQLNEKLERISSWSARKVLSYKMLGSWKRKVLGPR